MPTINPSEWTAGGNITANNGLVKIKDGVLSKPRNGCAQNASGVPVQDRYKTTLTFGTPREINRFDIVGPNDAGMYSNPSDLVVSIRAAGQLIGTHTFPNVIFGANQIFQATNFTPTPATFYELTIAHPFGDSSIWVAQIVPWEGEGGGGGGGGGGGDEPMCLLGGKGQSNMPGASAIPPASVYANLANIFNFKYSGTIVPAVEPLFDESGTLWPQFSAQTALCSPLMGAANKLSGLLKLRKRVLAVGSAKGSTSHTEWNPGGPLFEGFIERMIAAKAAAPTGSWYGGVLSQQAEAATSSESTARAWMLAQWNHIEAVRSRLGEPDLPYVIIGLGPNAAGGYDGWPLLRFGQKDMRLPHNCAVVVTDDLSSGGGSEWVVTASVLTIGDRAGEKVHSLMHRHL